VVGEEGLHTVANKKLGDALSEFSFEKIGFLVAGAVVAVFVGDALLPSLAVNMDDRVFAAVKGGVGAVVGLVAHQIYVRTRGR
jgi:hypothetical protein